MNILLFGATGMVGHGVLLECLADPTIQRVVSIVRRPTGINDGKLREIVHRDFMDYAALEKEMTGIDACFFCLGVSSAGMSEAEYTEVTHDYAMAAATTLVRLNPSLTFCFVSGAGTNAQGRSMWARVKGRTEDELIALCPRGYALRPAYIQPMKGVVSATPLYRALYVGLRPFYPVLKACFPGAVTTTVNIGRAMINLVGRPSSKRVLDPKDINALAAG